MDLDDIFPTPETGGPTIGEDLSQHSVEDLQARIEALNREIDRVQKEIEARSTFRSAAEDVFKS